MNGTTSARATIGAVVGAVLLSGCSLSPQADPSQFFVLTPMAESDGPAASGPTAALHVGLGPITFPEYLDRPQMVRRVGEHELRIDEFARWAEPVDSSFVRSLAQNLAILLGIEPPTIHPWYSTTPIDYAITLDVMRFEADTTGLVTLRCRWEIATRTGERISARTSVLTEVAGSAAPAQTVAALSRTVGQLSEQIAEEIRRAAGGS